MEGNIHFVEFINVLTTGYYILVIPVDGTASDSFSVNVTLETILKGRNLSQGLFSWMFHFLF